MVTTSACVFSHGAPDLCTVHSLFGNPLGDAVKSSVRAAVCHTPPPDIVEHYRVLRERHQWAVLQFVPTFTCYHHLCRPHAREALVEEQFNNASRAELVNGRSEFYGLVKTSASTLGMRALAKDFGLQMEPHVFCDATAGKGIASRKHAGKVRHIHTPSLWLQQCVAERQLQLHKCDGETNIADLGTKHIEGNRIRMLLHRMGHVIASGRSALSLKAAV